MSQLGLPSLLQKTSVFWNPPVKKCQKENTIPKLDEFAWFMRQAQVPVNYNGENRYSRTSPSFESNPVVTLPVCVWLAHCHLPCHLPCIATLRGMGLGLPSLPLALLLALLLASFLTTSVLPCHLTLILPIATSHATWLATSLAICHLPTTLPVATCKLSIATWHLLFPWHLLLA